MLRTQLLPDLATLRIQRWLGRGALIEQIAPQREGIRWRLETVEPLFKAALDGLALAQAETTAGGLKAGLGLLT